MAQKTGIKVIVVGAGFGGLTAAIECHRQGHDVEIYEAFPELKILGDIISFGSNAGRIFYRWGENASVVERLKKLSIRHEGFHIHKWDTGEVVYYQPRTPDNPTAPPLHGHRGELHEVVFEHVRDELKIPIHLGHRVSQYFEEDGHAGIVLQDGTRVSSPSLPCAILERLHLAGSRRHGRRCGRSPIEGPRTRPGIRRQAKEQRLRRLARMVTSLPSSRHSSATNPPPFFKTGATVLTANPPRFSNKDMIADPRTKAFCENGDTFNGWIGRDVHFLFSTLKGGADCCWVLTHRDDHDIDESWSFPGKLPEVLEVLKDWDPTCTAIVEKTPPEVLVDWKLVYRDPLPTWVSPRGRIALLGDSAHPFLPTSAQGATQSMEDGVTLAVCLRRAGKGNVPAAVRCYQDLR